MSIHSNVTEQESIIRRKLAEQQKHQRALKFQKRLLKQTQELNLAESLSFFTKNQILLTRLLNF